jgi:hypothetical protein
MAGKRMKARFNGKCLDCGGRIHRGDDIIFVRGEGAGHADEGYCAYVIEDYAEKRYFDMIDRQYEIRGFYDDEGVFA